MINFNEIEKVKNMKKLNRSAVALSALIALLVAGCGENPEFQANNRAAFKACIDTGGVPVQAWFNEKVLGDCIYKPVPQGN